MERILLLLLLLPGCRVSPDPVPEAAMAEHPAPAAGGAEARAPLVNRVWVRSDDGSPPGSARIFLDDGTLIQDSCWEVYRLSRWSTPADGALRWEEDGAEVRADVLVVNDRELTLRLHLTSGAEEQRFRPAEVPFVCPELPR